MAHYFPIMRTKSGEATALSHLTAAARAKITPIINIVTAPTPGYAASLTAAWTGQSAALDGAFNYSETGSVAAFNALFSAIGQGGVSIVPSITLNDPTVYIAAVQAVVGMFAPGLVVQTSIGNLTAAAGWVTAAGWATVDVDLVINAGDVSNYDTATFGNYVASTINPNVVVPNQWRSISLHSYSAPRDYSGLAPGFNDVPRFDWLLWQHVHPGVGYELGFSDCGQIHAAMEEVPGAAMASATVSVRYAIDDKWLIRKGVRTTGPNGLPMGQQYRDHARALVAHPQFNAVAGCWADAEIRRYAAVPVGGQAGGRTQWSSIGMNRHLSLVADRLP